MRILRCRIVNFLAASIVANSSISLVPSAACLVDPCRYWYAGLERYCLLNLNYALLFIYKGRQPKIDVSVNISEGEFSSCLG